MLCNEAAEFRLICNYILSHFTHDLICSETSCYYASLYINTYNIVIQDNVLKEVISSSIVLILLLIKTQDHRKYRC